MEMLLPQTLRDAAGGKERQKKGFSPTETSRTKEKRRTHLAEEEKLLPKPRRGNIKSSIYGGCDASAGRSHPLYGSGFSCRPMNQRAPEIHPAQPRAADGPPAAQTPDPQTRVTPSTSSLRVSTPVASLPF